MILYVEYLLYFYMAICIALLVFHIGFLFYEKIYDYMKESMQRYYYQQICQTLRQTQEGHKPHKGQLERMERSLHYLSRLVAFHHAVEQLRDENEESLQKYLHLCRPIFQRLASYYRNKDAMRRAYYAYLIKEFRIQHDSDMVGALPVILLEYLDNSTIYCRENVLQAFYQLGNIDVVETAFQYLYDHHIFHHNKLLSDGLMSFQGDKRELADRLWKHHTEWSEDMVVSIVNFIRMTKLDYKEEFLTALQDKATLQEVVLAIIRYFRIQPYTPAMEWMCEELEDDATTSVMRSVIATTLQAYPSASVKRYLRDLMQDSDWYVRRNAAASFLAMHPDNEELQAIIQGKDRYARDMLFYQLNHMRKEEQQV